MRKFLLLIVLVFATNNLFAETGKDLLDACEKAMGHNRFAEFKTCKIEASINQMGIKAELVIYKKGNNIRLEQSAMGQEMVYVVTENAFFMLKPSFQELPMEQAESITGQISVIIPNVAEFKKEVQPENIALAGLADFNGKSAKKVKLSNADGDSFLFLDPVTNWLTGVSIPDAGLDLTFESMKRVRGFVYPSVIKMTQSGQSIGEITVNSFEVDIELADSLFAKE